MLQRFEIKDNFKSQSEGEEADAESGSIIPDLDEDQDINGGLDVLSCEQT